MKKIKIFTLLSTLLFTLMCANQQSMAQTNIGDTAPNIKLPDENKQDQLLSAQRGKFVLLYFWVSWDPNSRINNPNLGVVRNKYKDVVFSGGEKGFEVFTVSLDSDRDEWLSALRKDKMQGIAVNDAYSKYAGAYKITNITTSLLLDGNGKIVGKDLSMSQLDKTLAGFATNYVVTNTKVKTTTTTAPAKTTAANKTAAATYNTTGKVNATTATKGQKYRIQLGAYRNPDLSQFSSVKQYGNIISEATSSGVKRILLGEYASPEQAVMTLNKIKTSGYPDAFVTIYKNDARSRVMSKSEVLAVNEYLNAASQSNSQYATLTPAAATTTQTATSSTTNTASVQQQTSGGGSIATTIAPSTTTTKTTTRVVNAPIQISVFETTKAPTPSTGTYYDQNRNIANTTTISQPTQTTASHTTTHINNSMPTGTGISESYTRTEMQSPSYASHPANHSGSSTTTSTQGRTSGNHVTNQGAYTQPSYNQSTNQGTYTQPSYNQSTNQGTYTQPTYTQPTYNQPQSNVPTSNYGSNYNTSVPQSGGQTQGYNVGNGGGSSDAVRKQQQDASEILDKALNEHLDTYKTKKAPTQTTNDAPTEVKEEEKRTRRSFWKRLTGK